MKKKCVEKNYEEIVIKPAKKLLAALKEAEAEAENAEKITRYRIDGKIYYTEDIELRGYHVKDFTPINCGTCLYYSSKKCKDLRLETSMYDCSSFCQTWAKGELTKIMAKKNDFKNLK